MHNLFNKLDNILKNMPENSAYVNGSCDAVALGISDFVLKHYPSLIPVYIIISRITYDEDANVLDDNDCSHIVVGFKSKYNDQYDTWDSAGKKAYENWEDNWFDEPYTTTDFFGNEIYTESKLIRKLYDGKTPLKNTPYDPIVRRTIFEYLEFSYTNELIHTAAIEPSL